MKTLIETTFKRLEKHFNENDCAFISACRGDNTASENNIKTEELKEKLRKMGYGYIAIRGGYIENKGTPEERPVEDEKSFAVFNNNDQAYYHTEFLKDMITLCAEFNQDAVLVKLKGQLGHYYDKNGKASENFNYIDKNMVEQYFSRLRNTKFAFIEEIESDMENYSRHNQTFSSKVQRSLLYAELEKKYPNIYQNN